MKKIIMCLLLICLGINLSIFVNASSVDLNNMDIMTKKIREDGEIKVLIELDFETDKDIIIKGISSSILGQTQQSSNITQTKKEILDGDKTKYLHHITYIVEYWQIGTMSLQIEYVNVEDFSTSVVDFYISGGRWQSSEITWKNAIIFGLFASLMVGLATLIIIDCSKKGFMDFKDE